jgi:hypothetical protein
LAGLDGRTVNVGFRTRLATVSMMGEPGILPMGFTAVLAGLHGRIDNLGFRLSLATVSGIGEPGTI